MFFFKREFVLPELNCQAHRDFLTSSILGSEQTHEHHQLYTFIFAGSPQLRLPTLVIEIIFPIVIIIIFYVQTRASMRKRQ